MPSFLFIGQRTCFCVGAKIDIVLRKGYLIAKFIIKATLTEQAKCKRKTIKRDMLNKFLASGQHLTMKGEISMGRLPYQVLVILFIKKDNQVKYCIFERNSAEFQVQFIAGGGEKEESPLEAAKREVFEESGVTMTDFIQLTSICHIPTNIFSKEQRKAWGNDVFVIPEYSFGAEVKSKDIIISTEHISFKWASYDEAIKLLKWDSNKTALYELNCRITANFM